MCIRDRPRPRLAGPALPPPRGPQSSAAQFDLGLASRLGSGRCRANNARRPQRERECRRNR
eukprot:6566078-Alexandrium_andersonii.AAC.1